MLKVLESNLNLFLMETFILYAKITVSHKKIVSKLSFNIISAFYFHSYKYSSTYNVSTSNHRVQEIVTINKIKWLQPKVLWKPWL